MDKQRKALLAFCMRMVADAEARIVIDGGKYLTRNAFIGGEAARLLHGDKDGRSFYCPPNCSSNATFLQSLRYLLIQDWDMDEDGRADTLRLLYAAPRRWLKDGATLTFQRAPTMFGEVSLLVESRLTDGHVTVDLVAPPRSPQRMSLRVPLPAGWKVTAVRMGDAVLPVDQTGAVDLTGRSGSLRVVFDVSPHAPVESTSKSQ